MASIQTEELNKSAEWGVYKDEILKMYGEEGWTLRKISQRMREKHGLKKSDRQYKRLFRNNHICKNQTAATWAAVNHQVNARGDKRSEVLLRGEVVPQAKLERNRRRYANGPFTQSSLDHVVVRTPPSRFHETDNAGISFDGGQGHTSLLRSSSEPGESRDITTPWELIDFRSPPQQVLWEGESIDVPEDAMDVEDLGNIEALNGRARRLNLQGLDLFENLGEGDNLILEVSQTRSDHHLISSRYSIPRGPSYSCLWESLTVMLAEFVDSEGGYKSRDYVNGHPREAKALQNYSRVDLLSFTIALSLNDASPILWHASARTFSYELHKWLSHPGPNHLLKLLLFSANSQRAKGLALSLIERTWVTEVSDFDISNHQGVLITAFEALLSLRDDELSNEQMYAVFSSALQWPSPDLLCRVISRRGAATDLVRTADNISDVHPNIMLHPAARFPQTAALLLRHGAQPTPALSWAVRAYLEARSGRSHDAEANLILMLLSHGADPDTIMYSTMPLTVAEHAAYRSPAARALLRSWVGDRVSQEVIRTLDDSCDVVSLRQASPMAKELLVLALCHDSPIDIECLERLLQNGAHPDLPSLRPKGGKQRGVGMAVLPGFFHTPTDRIEGHAESRAKFGFHSRVDRPIDLALVAGDKRAVLTLLKSGSSPPRKLLHPPPLTAPQADASVLRELIEELMQPERLSLVGGALFHFAIAQEDTPLASRLIDLGLDLNQTIHVQLFDFFQKENCTLLLVALIKCSFSFAQEVWRMIHDSSTLGDRAQAPTSS